MAQAAPSGYPWLPDVHLFAERSIYLGAAGFWLADADAGAHWVRIGFDCGAYVGRLQLLGKPVGVFVLPYGPWTAEPSGAAVVDELGGIESGAGLNLEYFVDPGAAMLPVELFEVREELGVSSRDPDSEPDSENHIGSGGPAGTYAVMRYGEDPDWLEGPILIVRTDALNTRTMSAYAEGALAENDDARAEFWYVELITSGADESTIAASIVVYLNSVLLPQLRFGEADVYLHLLDTVSNDLAGLMLLEFQRAEVDRLRTQHGASRYTRPTYWRPTSSVPPLDPSTAPAAQYLRGLSYFHQALEFGELGNLLADPRDPTYIPNVAGILVGLGTAIAETGGDPNPHAQALADCLTSKRMATSNAPIAGKSQEPSRAGRRDDNSSMTHTPTRNARYRGVIAVLCAVLLLGVVAWTATRGSQPVAAPTGYAPEASRTATTPASKPLPTVAPKGRGPTRTDNCHGDGKPIPGHLKEVRLTHNPAAGRIVAEFNLARPLPIYGDDAALLIWIAGSDGLAAVTLGVDWQDGQLTGPYLQRMPPTYDYLPRTDIPKSFVTLGNRKITATFPDDEVRVLGSGWGWLAATSANSTDIDGCPSKDDLVFQTFPER